MGEIPEQYLVTASWCKPCGRLKKWVGEQKNDLFLDGVYDIEKDFYRLAGHSFSTIPALLCVHRNPDGTMRETYTVSGTELVKERLTGDYYG